MARPFPKVWQTGEVTVTPSVAAPATQPAAGRPARRREPCVLLKLGEIVLKGRNRQQFERLLHTNIRSAVRDLEFAIQLWQREGVILLRVEGAADPEAAADAVAARMQDVPGVVRVCRALRVAKTPEAAAEAAVELTAGRPGSFAVRARRRDKRFGMRSSELAAYIGTRVQQAYGYPVNLSHPGHDGVRRGGPARGVRVHRGPARPGRAAGGDERPRARAHVRRASTRRWRPTG